MTRREMGDTIHICRHCWWSRCCFRGVCPWPCLPVCLRKTYWSEIDVICSEYVLWWTFDLDHWPRELLSYLL